MDKVHEGAIAEIVVTYKYTLCRFGSELLEWFFEKHNVKLVVLNTNHGSSNPSEELAEDLLAITTVFVARNNGLRSGRYKRERRLLKEREEAKDTTNC